MKRRKILGAFGVIGIPGLGLGQTTSMYGTPISVTGPITKQTEPLRLLLNTVNIPEETMPLMIKFGTVWEKVLGDEASKRKFQYDPMGFLTENGIPSSVLDSRDQEILLLKAFTDQDVIKAALSGDYLDFLNRLKNLGFSSQAGKSNLKKQVLSVLKNNLTNIKAKISMLKLENGASVAPYTNSQELTYLYGQLTPSIEQVAMAAVPVAIAAIVVVYVSVAAVVTVGILAGVYISLAVMTAITAGVGDGDNCLEIPDSAMFAGPAGMPQVGRTLRQRQIQSAVAQRELLGKRMLILGPERLQEAQQAVRLARLLNQGKFVLEANRQLLRDEISIFLEAAEEVGLLTIPKDTRPQIIFAIQNVALRAAALD